MIEKLLNKVRDFMEDNDCHLNYAISMIFSCCFTDIQCEQFLSELQDMLDKKQSRHEKSNQKTYFYTFREHLDQMFKIREAEIKTDALRDKVIQYAEKNIYGGKKALCKHCGGSGCLDSDMLKCDKCNGTGIDDKYESPIFDISDMD